MTVLDSLPPPSKGATVPLGLGEVLAGKYRVEKLLGAGGMGIVVLAKHLELDRPVAIKLMREEALKDAEARARFAREAKAVVRLRSEHVARVTDVGTLDDGAPFLVMEYLQGNDLGAVLSDIGKLPTDDAVAYLLQICEGMAEAHGAGIIHRDLKPRNIFVTAGAGGAPLLKILDFGISKIVPLDGGTIDLSLTKTTDVMGSPSYMAPEQLRSARDADERSDIWSLGVMLYELVTGRLPWEARSITELGAMVLRDPLEPMITHCPGVSPELDAIVARCLQKDPAKRYRSVVELANALAPHARGLARTSVSWGRTELDPPKTTLPPPEVPSPRRIGILAALLAVVVLAAGGSLFALRAPKASSTPPVLPDDRGAVKPPATTTLPPPSVTMAALPAPPATGTASAVVAPIATVPRRARAAPSAPIEVAPPLPSSPPAPTANAHDMGAIPRK